MCCHVLTSPFLHHPLPFPHTFAGLCSSAQTLAPSVLLLGGWGRKKNKKNRSQIALLLPHSIMSQTPFSFPSTPSPLKMSFHHYGQIRTDAHTVPLAPPPILRSHPFLCPHPSANWSICWTVPVLTMRHLEFCQNKFRCETASSANKVAKGAAERAAAHEGGRGAQPRVIWKALSGITTQC